MSNTSLLLVPELQDKKKWNCLTLQENLARCYNENLYFDAVLKVQNKIFRAHRSILCFHSPILKKEFYSTDIPASACTIKNIKPEGFQILLRYLYTSEISNEVQVDDLMEACHAAEILQMMEIGKELIHYIFYQPRSGTYFSGKTTAEVEFWLLLAKYRLPWSFGDLQEKLVNFAESKFTSVFDSEGFVEADIKTIKLVLDRKFPSVPQKYVVESIARWVEANDHLVFLDKYIRELLNCVDFKRLSPKEFYAVACKYDRLLSKKDSLDILMHLVDPRVCPLPEWCQLDDKGWRNRETESKPDKFKSTNNIWSNQRSSDWRKRDSQSQEDLRKTAKVKNSEKQISGKYLPPALRKMLLEVNFNKMLNEDLFTDVTLIAKDNIEIPAHSLVLALRSEFFANVFYEATPASKVFSMEETAEEVKEMLRYFYGCGTGSLFRSSLDCILKKIEMALKYQCYPLMRDCNDALSRTTLDPVNVWTVTDWVDRLSHSKVVNGSQEKPDQTQPARVQTCLLSQIMMRYAATSTKELFEHDFFLQASKGSLMRILKSDYLSMTEGDILEHVAGWMEKNAQQLRTDSSKKKLLGNIRFEALVSEQFFAFLKKHDGIFPIRDSFVVLEFLFRRSEENRLPDWCYRGPLRSIFYDPSKKIGTVVQVPWLKSPEKGKRQLRCSYAVTIRDKRPKSEIQFLELSLKFKAPSGKCPTDCSCIVTIETDGWCSPKTFQGLKMCHPQRYLLPVFFRLDASYNRSLKLVITVNSKLCHKFYSVRKQALEFDNVTFLPTSGEMNYLCDAIVDGFTSENVPIPPHVLSENEKEANTTEKCLKVATEQKT